MLKVGVEYVCGMDTIVDAKFLEIDHDDLDFRPRIWGVTYTVKEDGSEVLEEVADSKPHIKFRNDKPWLTFQKARGGLAKVTVESLKGKQF